MKPLCHPSRSLESRRFIWRAGVLPSERAIAARCGDSIAIRQFLHYELTEATPDHSSLSVIRQRLDGPIYEQVFTLVLSALQEHGLLKGRNVGIDSSVMEANASLRGLVNRNTGEAYWEYVKRLAAQSGIDPEDSAAVRQFDRQRPKKMSNQETNFCSIGIFVDGVS